MNRRSVFVVTVFSGLSLAASAQWLEHRDPAAPRARDGKINLTAPAPRDKNGKVDLSGLWQAEQAPLPELMRLLPGGANGLGEDIPSQYFINILADFKQEGEYLQPASAVVAKKNIEGLGKDGPITHCLPGGVPLLDAFPAPFKVIQTAAVVVFLYEGDNSFRQVFVDGRKHPQDAIPTWIGYSVGKWDGDSLVVETTGFNDRGWLDAMGHTHSDALRITERFRRLDFGHMEVRVTVDDPKTFTKPFSYTIKENLVPDSDVIEYVCAENEHDVPHLVGK